MMRMLAWVNLLQTDGLVNKALSIGGIFDVHVAWLTGHAVTVVLGLVYGYVPYMILPLYAGLDRIPAACWRRPVTSVPAGFETFRRVTCPLTRPAVVVSLLLTSLPMLGDYFTDDLLSGLAEHRRCSGTSSTTPSRTPGPDRPGRRRSC